MTAKRILCLVLVLTQVGCRSVYRLHCTSDPTPAGVLAGQEFLGETACTIEIPEDSEWIEDGRIELTFVLPDGTEKKRIVDLRGCEPSEPLAEIVSWPFVVGGLGLIWLGHDEDDSSSDDDDDGEELVWFGAGALGIGAGLYLLFGGDFDHAEPYPIYVDFNASGGGQ